MLRVKINIDGEEKIIPVKEIYVSSYEDNKVHYLLTCTDNTRYSCSLVFDSSDYDDYDIQFVEDFNEVK